MSVLFNSPPLSEIDLGTNWEEGDLLGARIGAPPKAHKMDLRDGTAASPVKIGTSASLSRLDATTRAEVNAMGPEGTDGPDGATVLRTSIKGTAASEVQIAGVVASAWQTGAFGEAGADACSILALARVSGGATGRAIGGYAEISIETASARGGQAFEYRVKNEAEAHPYVADGPSRSMGEWMRAGGGFNSGAAYQIGAGVSGRTFEGGYTINEGAVSGFGFRDDSSSLRSVFVKGSHEKAAIAVAKGAGQTILGAETPNQATPLFEVYSEAGLDPIVSFGTDKAVAVSSQLVRNSAGNMRAFVASAANNFLTGTASGDTGLAFTAGKIFHLGANTKTSQFRMSETGIGFFSTAPVAKPTGVAKTAEGVWTALNTLGLIA